MPSTMTKRCTVCRKFRAYDLDDKYCVECGNESLEAECKCGRVYDYAIPEEGPAHCPRCGMSFRGKAAEYDG